MPTIYRIRRKWTDECYIGSTGLKPHVRWMQHLYLLRLKDHHARHLQRAFDSDGEAGLAFEVVEECLDEDRYLREQYHIDNSCSCLNANRFADENGKAGYKLTPEQRARQWIMDPALRQAAALKRIGLKRSDEQRDRMAAAQQNNPLVGQHRVGFKETSEQTEKRRALARAGMAANPMIWITNGSLTMKHSAREPIPEGFRAGRSFSASHTDAVRKANAEGKTEEAKAHMRASRLRFLAENPERHQEIVATTRPMIWYTDGSSDVKIPASEVAPDGWRRGRSLGTDWKSLKWITNGSEGRRIPKNDPIPVGWREGFPPKGPRNPELEPSVIASRLAAGETPSDVARALGVSVSSVHRAANKGGRKASGF